MSNVGRQRFGERRVRPLEGQEPGGEVAELSLGEPGADRAEVIEPVGLGSANQDRSREVGGAPARGSQPPIRTSAAARWRIFSQSPLRRPGW